MKNLMLMLFLIPLSIHAQNEKSFDLKWKINDTLTYATIVKDTLIEEEQPKEEVDSVLEASKCFLKEWQAQMPELQYETRLSPDKNKHVDITMYLFEIKRDSNNNIISDKPTGNRNVALRGKVSPEGELVSFYYKSAQNNLIALLFELPNKPVKVGEAWSSGISLIEMDHNYVADTFHTKDKIYLDQIIEEEGDTIAIVKYDIEEYVSGEFGNAFKSQSGDKKNEKIFMRTTYQALGKFSITKGMWIAYDGVMEIESNFSIMGMGGKKRTEFKLTPEANKSL